MVAFPSVAVNTVAGERQGPGGGGGAAMPWGSDMGDGEKTAQG